MRGGGGGEVGRGEGRGVGWEGERRVGRRGEGGGVEGKVVRIGLRGSASAHHHIAPHHAQEPRKFGPLVEDRHGHRIPKARRLFAGGWDGTLLAGPLHFGSRVQGSFGAVIDGRKTGIRVNSTLVPVIDTNTKAAPKNQPERPQPGTIMAAAV